MATKNKRKPRKQPASLNRSLEKLLIIAVLATIALGLVSPVQALFQFDLSGADESDISAGNIEDSVEIAAEVGDLEVVITPVEDVEPEPPIPYPIIKSKPWWTNSTNILSIVGIVVMIIIAIFAYRQNVKKKIEVIIVEKSPAPTPPEPPPVISPDKIWNVPHHNEYFRGRNDHLKTLEEKLKKGESVALVQSAAMLGKGGIGKTQIAKKYAYDHIDEYDIIWWISSETPESISADYEKLGLKLDVISPDEPNKEHIRDTVRQHLEEISRKWLLIFDNAEKYEDILDYRPTKGNGNVIITSREQVWGRLGECIKVDIWEPEESLGFILDRTGSDDNKAAKELAKTLGHFPLALEQACAYIKDNSITIRQYIELYAEDKLDLFDEKPQDYKETVVSTWKVSFKKIEEESKGAIGILHLISFLHAEDIPLEIISGGVEYLPKWLGKIVSDKNEFNKAIGILLRYSIVTKENEKLNIHRLVQEVLIDSLSTKEKKKWAEAATEIVNDAFPQESDDHTTWEICSALLPHGISVIKWAESLDITHNALIRLLNQIGLYHRVRAELKKAENTLKRAVDIAEEKLEQDDTALATTLNNLGGVLKDLGDFEGAKANFERALEIDEKEYGLDHPDVARDLNNLGSVLQDMGDYESAKANYERALAIDEKVYGPDHPLVATIANNLGSVLRAIGDYEGAKANYERALEIGEKVYGPVHPDVATDVNNLGSVLHDMGDYEGAKANFERALAIDEKVYGPDHPDVARDVNNLGGVLYAMGDYVGAKENFERALEIDEKVYGPDHPAVATDVNNLGGVLQDLGDHAGAKENYERALEIFTDKLGPDHPKTNTARRNLEFLKKKMSGK